MIKNVTKNNTEIQIFNPPDKNIQSLIYIIRDKQVMLDSDLASLYNVKTKVFNQAVNRNIERFPNNFRFQLNEKEYSELRSQFVTSNKTSESKRGGRRYLPYAFTEQGIAMLSGILNSAVAIKISIRIMNTFVEMRKFIANNDNLFKRISNVELKQLEYQKNTDEKFEKVFRYIETHAEAKQKIFFDGQIYDAFSLLTSIIKKAKEEIILIDGYVDIETLNILSKKNPRTKVFVYTHPKTKLTATDINNFNSQYPILNIKHTEIFHDRFVVIDKKEVYHIGASLKDAGKKCFAISLFLDNEIINNLLNKLKSI